MKAGRTENGNRFLSDRNRVHEFYNRLEAGETEFTIDGWKVKLIKSVTFVNGGQKRNPAEAGFHQ